MKPKERFSTTTLNIIGSPMAYYPVISLALKDVSSALIVCQFMHWEGKQIDEDGWIYKSQEDLLYETGLTDKVQRRCREHLKKLGILEECRKTISIKNNKKQIEFKNVIHYRFDWGKLEELINTDEEVKERYTNRISKKQSEQTHQKDVSITYDQPDQTSSYFSNQPDQREVCTTYDQPTHSVDCYTNQPDQRAGSTIYNKDNNKTKSTLRAHENFLEKTNKEKKSLLETSKNFEVSKTEKNSLSEKQELEKKLAERDIFRLHSESLINDMLTLFNQRGTQRQKEILEKELFEISRYLEISVLEMQEQLESYFAFKKETKGLLHNTPQAFLQADGFATNWVNKLKEVKKETLSETIANAYKANRDLPPAYFL